MSWSRSAATPSFEGHLPQLGTDFAGVVTAVGPDVTDHQVGDHVGGMSPNGCWGTFVTCDANLAATLPPGLTDAPGRRGDHRVRHRLVRPQRSGPDQGRGQGVDPLRDRRRGAGGDRDLPAPPEPRSSPPPAARSVEQLLRDMGIEHVYDSRSIEFAEQIRQDTDGYGVDIVLNSVTGAAQLAGIKLLALGGRFVEIGKRDIYGDTRLGLVPVPPQPGVLRRRRGVDVGQSPRRSPRAVEHGVSADRRGHPADAARHALPAGRSGHRDPGDERGRTHRQAHPRRPAHRHQQRGAAPRAGARLPRRRLLHHHRRPGRTRGVPRREDGTGRALAASCSARAPSRIKRRSRPST